MIIAHRLLKNQIQDPEYLLATQNYLDHLGDDTLPPALTWQSGSDTYPAVGSIAYHYALLGQFKTTIPAPPKRESPVMALGEDSLSLDIHAPLVDVYQKLIDLDSKSRWIVGLEDMEREEVTERIGLKHTCILENMVADIVSVDCQIGDDHITYREEGEIREAGIAFRTTYQLQSLAGETTSLTLNVRWLHAPKPPEDFVSQFLGFWTQSLELFKQLCESTVLTHASRTSGG